MTTLTLAPTSLSLLDSKGSVVKTWPLASPKTYKIGRGRDNDILLEGSWVSRQHALVQIEENGTVNALDLGSANGTMVNGHRIYTPTPLRSGDLIQIGGKSVLTFLRDYQLEIAPTSDDEAEQTVAFITRGQVTVLICDIRRFTELSERIGDKMISEIIRVWSHKTNDLVKRYHGHVDKFIGDAVMAIWVGGEGRATAHQALTCTAHIAAMTVELGGKIGSLPWPLTIGAAINTGEAAIGNVGVDGNRDCTVIGDTVNVAFRLEGLTAKVGKDLLLGNDTAALLDQTLLASYFTPCQYQVKGKSQPVTAHGCTFEQLRRYLAHHKAEEEKRQGPGR